ncbi:MAG: terminase [Bryobacterales bacterium]|nr:terminase [Bryobacterales bacterium]
MKQPDVRLTPPQWTVFNNPSRFRVLVAGRRFGKTYLSIPELLKMAWGRGREAWYVAPTYRQAKQIAWRQLKRIASRHIVKKDETDLSLELRCGGRVALRGADNYDSLRGVGLDGLILDEYADIAPEAWTEALRPMLSDRLGRALFIGTPEGFNHFFELYDEARAGKPDWSAWQFTTAQGGNVPAEEIEAARHDMDGKTFRQEYEASFENIGSGRVYYCFERGGNVEAVEFNTREPLCWSLDFNIGLMCSVLAQRIGDRLNVLDELILPDSSTYDACNEFLARAEKYLAALRGNDWGIVPTLNVEVYGDASGQNRQHAGPSDWQIVREFFSRTSDRFRVNFNIRSSNPAIRDRVNALNARLHNHAGERNLLIHPRCKELVADLEQVLWKSDPHGNTLAQLDQRNPRRTHVSDALGYLVEKEFGLRIVGGPRQQYLGV